MPNPTLVKQDLLEVIDNTAGANRMPFLLNVQYGQLYPAVYIDEVRALLNGDRVGLTMFVLSKELPREKVADLEKRLGRKTDQLERDGIYALQVLKYQNEELTPIAEYLASVLIGERNVNLEKEVQFPYKLQSTSYGTIDKYSGSQRGIFAVYNDIFTKMNLIGITMSIEVSGGNASSVFCHLPHNLQTDWRGLSAQRSVRCKPKLTNATCELIPEIPEGATLITKQNFPTAFGLAQSQTGSFFKVLLGKWHNESDAAIKTNLETQIISLLSEDIESDFNYEIGKVGESYYIVIQELPF